jgi:hypothetical protein
LTPWTSFERCERKNDDVFILHEQSTTKHDGIAAVDQNTQAVMSLYCRALTGYCVVTRLSLRIVWGVCVYENGGRQHLDRRCVGVVTPRKLDELARLPAFRHPAPAQQCAASDGKLEKVKDFVASGVDVNSQDEVSVVSIVHFAVCSRVLCGEDNRTMISCSVFQMLQHGYSALHAAASYGNKEVLQWLLTNGGSHALRDEDGDTPLHSCEDEACARLLVDAGADITAVNSEDVTAYAVAVTDGRKDLASYLRQLYIDRGLAVPAVDEPSDDEDGDDDDDDGDDDAE